MPNSTDNDRRHTASQIVSATPHAAYAAFVRPECLVKWLPPQGATGRILLFEPRPAGRFEMTLTFDAAPGKSSANTDVVRARFVELLPGRRIVLAVSFASDDPSFAGVMTMTWTFEAEGDGTRVTIVAEDVPAGISRADHEVGLRSTLANLQGFCRSRP